MQGENSSKTRNAEDEACARELLVLGGRAAAKGGKKATTSHQVKLVSSKKQQQQPLRPPPQSPGIATIVLDNSEIINGNDIDDTFTFITGDTDTTGLSMVEPTLNSAILTQASPSDTKASQRIIMHVPPPSSSASSNSVINLSHHHQPTFAHALDGNLTDAESSEDEEPPPPLPAKVEDVDKREVKQATTGVSSVSVQQESSTSHSSESSSTVVSVTNAIISTNSQVSSASVSGLLDLSAPKLSDTSTEDVDDNQPIDYSKKTLSCSSNSSSSSSSSNNSSANSSMVSPTTTTTSSSVLQQKQTTKSASSSSSGSTSFKILSVESLLSRSPPRSLQHQSTTAQLESASKTTPYHPELTGTPDPVKAEVTVVAKSGLSPFLGGESDKKESPKLPDSQSTTPSLIQQETVKDVPIIQHEKEKSTFSKPQMDIDDSVLSSKQAAIKKKPDAPPISLQTTVAKTLEAPTLVVGSSPSQLKPVKDLQPQIEEFKTTSIKPLPSSIVVDETLSPGKQVSSVEKPSISIAKGSSSTDQKQPQTDQSNKTFFSIADQVLPEQPGISKQSSLVKPQHPLSEAKSPVLSDKSDAKSATQITGGESDKKDLPTTPSIIRESSKDVPVHQEKEKSSLSMPKIDMSLPFNPPLRDQGPLEKSDVAATSSLPQEPQTSSVEPPAPNVIDEEPPSEAVFEKPLTIEPLSRVVPDIVVPNDSAPSTEVKDHQTLMATVEEPNVDKEALITFSLDSGQKKVEKQPDPVKDHHLPETPSISEVASKVTPEEVVKETSPPPELSNESPKPEKSPSQSSNELKNVEKTDTIHSSVTPSVLKVLEKEVPTEKAEFSFTKLIDGMKQQQQQHPSTESPQVSPKRRDNDPEPVANLEGIHFYTLAL